MSVLRQLKALFYSGKRASTMKHKRSWYVFECKRGHKKPKAYQGPYATEAEAKKYIAREYKKYGRESFGGHRVDSTYFKVLHLTAEGFSKFWG